MCKVLRLGLRNTESTHALCRRGQIFCLLSSIFCLLSSPLPAQVQWERVYEGILSNDTLPGFYCGGFERNKQTLCDIDADGDLDFFVGMWDGTIMFYENIGDSSTAKFKFITEKFGNINVRGDMKKGYAAPEFVDIDADSDYDCFVGDYIGKVHFYKNVGTAQACSFVVVDTHMFNPTLYRHANLAFVDIDADGDYDMWVGDEAGHLAYYQNTGTPDSFCFDSLIIDTLPHEQIDQTFCDIDNDNDYDLFYGEATGNVVFWRNDGDSATYNFVHITDSMSVPGTYDRGGGFFADIDGDSDFDLFLTGRDGLNRFCKNIGTPSSPVFDFVTEQYLYIDFDWYSCPTFCDIDRDGDMDMFVGADDQRVSSTHKGRIRLCRNVGDTLQSAWVYEAREFGGITTPSCPAPAFVSIDEDKDYDLFIGTSEGKIIFCRNVGTPYAPSWIFVTYNFANIDVGEYSKPTFGDIDADGDYDLIIGNQEGKILCFTNKGSPDFAVFDSLPDACIDSVSAFAAPTLGDVDLDNDLDIIVGMSDAMGCRNGKLRFYRNDGDSATPNWVVADTSIYNHMDVHRLSTPTLTDIDGDGDLDLFVGEGDGGINYWRNELIGVEEKDARCKMQDARIKIYPNPFTQKVVIDYRLTIDDHQIMIYDLCGRVVRTFSPLTNLPFNQIIWDGTDNSGERVPAGIYFCKLQVGDWIGIKKLIHIR